MHGQRQATVNPKRVGTVCLEGHQAQNRKHIMADIFIPGDELESTRQSLGFVLDNIDIGHHTFDFDKAFGRELSRGSAQNFENKWDDGKRQLQRQVKDIKSAIDSILDSFTRTDNDAVTNLDDGA